MEDVYIKQEIEDCDENELAKLIEEVKREEEVLLKVANTDSESEEDASDPESELKDLEDLLEARKQELDDLEIIEPCSSSENALPRKRENSLAAEENSHIFNVNDVPQIKRPRLESEDCIPLIKRPTEGLLTAPNKKDESEMEIENCEDGENNVISLITNLFKDEDEDSDSAEEEEKKILSSVQPATSEPEEFLEKKLKSEDEYEVECLPVIADIGKYKPVRIKVENEPSKIEVQELPPVTQEEKKVKALQRCTLLLKKFNSKEPEGRFLFTSTTTKLESFVDSNSIMHNIRNVDYDFHRIGPKYKLANMGLKRIEERNANVAKEISLDAITYFAKMSEATKKIVIKSENASTGDKKPMEEEEEEPTSSSFLRNVMTQTDIAGCPKCAARLRRKFHSIGVQTSNRGGNMGTQPNTDHWTTGLNDFQIRGLRGFVRVLREPAKVSIADTKNLMNRLLQIYHTAMSISSTGSAPSGPSRDPRRDPRRNPVMHSHPAPTTHVPHFQCIPMQPNSSHYREHEHEGDIPSNEIDYDVMSDPRFY